MSSLEILSQDFLRCNSYENMQVFQHIQLQEIFDRAQATDSILLIRGNADNFHEIRERGHVYESIEDMPYCSIESEKKFHIYETLSFSSQEKAGMVFSERARSLSIEGKFKKKDAKNIQRLEKLNQTLLKYSPGQVNFDVHFAMIMNIFKDLKTSSGKLAAFLYVLDSTREKQDVKLHMNRMKLYKELPRRHRKLIKKSSPKFGIDMSPSEVAKSIDAIRAHLEKRFM
jgi:hypothetical protein